MNPWPKSISWIAKIFQCWTLVYQILKGFQYHIVFMWPSSRWFVGELIDFRVGKQRERKRNGDLKFREEDNLPFAGKTWFHKLWQILHFFWPILWDCFRSSCRETSSAMKMPLTRLTKPVASLSLSLSLYPASRIIKASRLGNIVQALHSEVIAKSIIFHSM